MALEPAEDLCRVKCDPIAIEGVCRTKGRLLSVRTLSGTGPPGFVRSIRVGVSLGVGTIHPTLGREPLGMNIEIQTSGRMG